MYLPLFKQELRKTLRSKAFKQGWGIKILLGLLSIYFGLAFLGLGFFLPEVILEIYPEANSVTDVFEGGVLYYFLVALGLRYMLQDLDLLNVQHYLLLPIPRQRVIHFLLSKSVFNFFNLLPLLIIIPFALVGVSEERGTSAALIWAIDLVILVLANHFLAIYLKRAAAVKLSVFLGFVGVLALAFTADGLGYISLTVVSSLLFDQVDRWYCLPLNLLALILFYALNFRFLKRNSYIDQWTKKKKAVGSQNLNFLESRGAIGMMMANELKLILRNKRTRSLLFVSAFFMFYGFLFYGGDNVIEVYQGMGWKLFAGLFLTGIFMSNYGQFMLAWESAFFDGILTRAYPMSSVFEAKYWLMFLVITLCYVLSLFYSFIDTDAIFINTASYLYNIGVNSFLLMYASTYQNKRIDLSKGSAFNFQGTSAMHFVIAIPLFVVPILIFQAFSVFDLAYWGLFTLGAIGLISLLFYKQWIKATVANFREKKYRAAAGFREAN